MNNPIDNWQETFSNILNQVKELGISEIGQCDHICYRVSSLDDYNNMKDYFLKFGKLSAETIVSGRPISIIELNTPFQYEGYTIQCVELPAPKEGKITHDGWEHAEFVVENPASLIDKYPHLNFNTKSLHRDLNAELSLSLKNGLAVKFHPLHILEVIKLEESLGIKEVK